MEFKDFATNLVPLTLNHNNLYLDPNNPRLVGEKDYSFRNTAALSTTVQQNILNYFKKSTRYDIKELKDSIESVGFLKMDRIVVSKIPDTESAYLVIEGNRRTAAIKWLIQETEEGTLTLRDDVAESINNIEVLELKFDSSDDNFVSNATWFLQGLRHISGVKSWGPYQQAELIHKLTVEQGKSFADAGKAIGLGSHTAARKLRAYNALNQMQQNDEYKSDATPALFSHFEVAFTKPTIKAWLGWDEESKTFKNQNELNRYYELIVGDDENKPEPAMTIRDWLPSIIDTETARVSLMQGKNIEYCTGIVVAEKYSAPTWHSAAKGALNKLNAIPWSYDYTEEDIKLLSELNELTKQLIDYAKKLVND